MMNSGTPISLVALIDADDKRRGEINRSLEAAQLPVQSFSSIASWVEPPSSRAACLLLDFRLPDSSELVSNLARRRIDSPVVLIDHTARTADVAACLRGGAFDFLQWPSDQETLVARVAAAVHAGRERRRLYHRLESVLHRVRRLTKRERDVMRLVAQGHANKVVSFELGISERTVEVHRSNAMKKIGADSLAHLVRMDLAARCFENRSSWSMDQCMRGLTALIDEIIPAEDTFEDRRVA